MKKLLRRIRQILRDRRTRRFFKRFVGTFAAIVVFVTTYALVLPAITMEAEAQCGIEAHQHDDSCFEEVLVCDLPESDGHQHVDSCYEKVLVCGKESHTHSPACYRSDFYGDTAESTAVSGAESAAAVAGNTSVTATPTDEIIEGEYSEDEVIEEAGAAAPAADAETEITEDINDYTNTEESSAEASLSSASSGTSASESSGESTSESSDETASAFPGETVSSSTGETASVSSGEAVSSSFAASIAADDSDTNTGDTDTGDTDTGDTYEENTSAQEADKTKDADIGSDSDESATDDQAEKMALLYPALTFQDSIAASMGTLPTDTGSEKATALPDQTELTVHVEADEGAFPEGTTMRLSAAEDMDAVASAVEEAVTADDAVSNKTRGFHAVDISFWNNEGVEIEPLKPIRVSITSESIKQAVEDTSTAPVVVHVTDKVTDQTSADTTDAADENNSNDSGEKNTESIPETEENLETSETKKSADENADHESPVATIVETEKQTEAENGRTIDTDTLTFEAGAFSVYAIVYTVDFEYSVNGKMYQFSLPGGGFVSFTDLVEVLGIIGDTNSEGNGDETESVIVENAEGNAANDVVEENSVNFDTNTALTLGDVEVSEATRKFVADVASVEFSTPSLVDVSKVEADTTVGQIKEGRGLECEYSAELTEEQIAEINAQTVEAGDWALISVQPFMSEETLTVTMKDGEVFTIRVTDAQIKKTVIDAKGDTWEITVTYGEDAQIPDGAELRVEEILPEDEGYEEYYQKSLEKICVSAQETAETADTSAADVIESKGDEEETAVPAKKVTADYARFFNIEIWADGQKIEPAADVTVNIMLLDAPEKAEASLQVVHFAKDGAELMELKEKAENSEDEGIQFVTDEFSVYSVVYTVDFSYQVNGKVYEFTMQGADSVSLRALIDALHVYKLFKKENTNASGAGSKIEAKVTNADLAEQASAGNVDLDSFMSDIKTVTFSNEELLVPAKVEEDTTAGKIKTDLKLFPTYPLGLKQSEVLALNAKEYAAGDWALISMKAFSTLETLTITMITGETFKIKVTDAQDAVMIGDQVQTISNPAGTTIDLFDYWIVSQDLVGRDGWGDLNQDWGGHPDTEGDNGYNLNGSGNNKGINSSDVDSVHGHALKFSPAWDGTVYNGTKEGTHRYYPNWNSGDHNTYYDVQESWRSLNHQGKDGLNSYTGDADPFQGIVGGTLVNGYPVLTSNDTIGSNGESLAYLFDTGFPHAGKASYPGVNQLLYVDKEGYYTYDSRDYRADYNNGTFVLTEQTSDNTEIRGFWPFGTQNFWAGLHINTQFSMPVNGQVLNPSGEYKDMQFEFSGDDDTWLYVDGVLVGDGGGIHNRTEIDVNFSKGTVTVTGKKGGGHSGDFEETKYLDDIFTAAGKYNEDQWEEIGDGSGHKRFKPGTYHTFDMFYLERGGGESNLYIHYNLVSTADFTAHKSYYGEDETDLLRRDQFQFELIGLDGKYRSVKNNETGNYELVQEDTTSDAIMPHASGSGEGTVASPHYEDNVSTTLSNGGTVNSQVYITGVTEDGNINFGSASISERDMNEADQGNSPVYKYIIRESVPEDAVNQDGITWALATDAQKAAGGFVKNQVTYDGTVYYMTGRVTSWTETNASGQEVVRHGISKTYYTDDTYTTVKDDVDFVNFENRFTPDYGSVDFTKVDGAGDPLAGAEFTLYKDEACTIPATDLDTEGYPVWAVQSDSDGKVSFENVRVGTYYMKETMAPENYALSETIYKVVIEDEKDTSKTSKITILGDESGSTVHSIANAKSGEITVLKKWLNAAGTEIDGGSNTAKVKLKRYKQVVESSNVETHTVTINLAVRDYSGNSWTETTNKPFQGDHVTVEWTVVDGANDNVFTGQDSSYWDGSSRITIFSKSFRNVSSDITLNVILNEYWPMQNGKFNIDSFSIAQEEPDEPVINVVVDDDFNPAPITLNSSSSWSQTWRVGGTESSYSGFDYPAMDDNGKNYLYYVVELDTQGNAIEVGGSPLEGYVLQGYSANNNTGISNQGVITVYNRAEGSDAINVVIKKTDNAENSTNYLDGAVFKLMFRPDSSGTFTNVSNESVPELDSESKFAVPASGITLTGLVDGQYQLQEISPPSGYVITNSTPVTFTVAGGAITSTEGTITGVRYTAASGTSDAEFIIPNEPGAALPNTGGPGTRLFTIFGSIVILGAGVLLWRRRRLI